MKQDTTLSLNLNSSTLSLVASSSTVPCFDASAFSIKVKAFCSKISLPVQTPTALTPVDELKALISFYSTHIQPVSSQEEVQELHAICQGFAALDFSLHVEHQLIDQLEIYCQALAYLKPNNSEITQTASTHGTRSDLPYIQDLFQEREALQMVEKDMDDLQSQANSIQNSYEDKALKLQAHRSHEEELMKSLADV